MNFNNRTVIQPIGISTQEDAPQYRTIATIPRNAGPYDRFDVLGVLIFVREIQKVKGKFAQENDVCDVLIIDHSSQQPLTISAWNDLAGVFKNNLTSYPVFGFTSLKVTTHKGFSLATTISSAIITTPVGEKPDLLRTWAASHDMFLSQKREQILKTLKSASSFDTNTIAFVKAKKASNTIQDDRYWIRTFIKKCDYNDIKKFLGCNYCNRKTDTGRNEVFHCSWCQKTDCTSAPRLALKFDAEDATGSITLTAFTEVITHLFAKTAEELYAPNSVENFEAYEKIAHEIRDKPVYIELGPTLELSRNGVLKWVLKSASLEPVPIGPTHVKDDLNTFLTPSAQKMKTTKDLLPSPSCSSPQSSPDPLSKSLLSDSSTQPPKIKIQTASKTSANVAKCLDFSESSSTTTN